MSDNSLPPPPIKSSAPLLITLALAATALGAGFLWNASGSEPATATGEGAKPTVVAARGAHETHEASGDTANGHTAEAAETFNAAGLQLENAPPPPPDEEEMAAAEAKTKATLAVKRASTLGRRSALGGKRVGGPTSEKASLPPGCRGPCGAPSRSLTSSLRRRAGAARGCYQSGLRQNSMLSGKMTVGVRVAPNGRACFVRPVSNTLSDAAVSSCILQKFRGGGYPKPSGGCVEANVPLSFVSK